MSRRTSPGTDRGQLVDISDQQQVRAGGDGLAELVGQQQIQHGGFVDDHEVGLQGSVFVVSGVASGFELQNAVDGHRIVPGQFGQPFRGPPGGRG
jgi:hypothetical protein